MSNYKVTYLLGAGASYHSIPVVNTLNERMKLFIDMFIPAHGVVVKPGEKDRILLTKSNKFYEDYPECIKFLERFRSTFYEAIEHRTVDTYARKLYLKGDKRKLNDLKRFLALYFAFEQSNELNKYQLKLSNVHDMAEINKENQKTSNHIHMTLDYRYDVFFASLLNTELELPENVNIISWNYDHQLEMGYRNYTDYSIHECQEKLHVFPRGNRDSGRVIKLNGSAHQYYGTDLAPHLFDKIDGDIYKSILKSFSDSELKETEFALNFAWEKGPKQVKSIKVAESILAKTDELVIIGYSFPYFNRAVDIKLLSELTNKITRIKVMVTEADFEGIEQNIKDILGSKNIQIELHKDLSQFYIPTRFFGETPRKNQPVAVVV